MPQAVDGLRGRTRHRTRRQPSGRRGPAWAGAGPVGGWRPRVGCSPGHQGWQAVL